jgi:hypothetical protein
VYRATLIGGPFDGNRVKLQEGQDEIRLPISVEPTVTSRDSSSQGLKYAVYRASKEWSGYYNYCGEGK